MIGQPFSQYKVLEKLGEGGMGVVYKARDTQLDRDVALKFLPSHVSISKETTSRFLQEARAAAALNHANICTIYGVAEHDDADGSKRMFISMEYIDGGTLREKLPLAGGIGETASVAAQVGEALQEAHAKGVVHRDIKADNVMLTSRGQVKVMDFGLAKLKGSLKLTKTSSTVGTLGYMAPEQIGGGEVDARSDLFSFGVLIFEMLTGRLPFRGEHEAAMVYSIMNEAPEPLTKYLPDAPPELVLLISKALEKDPADRYQSVAEMLVDLRRLKKSTSRISRQYPAQASMGAPMGEAQTGMVSSGGLAAQGPAVRPGSGPGLPGSGVKKSIGGTKRMLIGALVVAVITAVVVMMNSRDRGVTISAANIKMSRLTSAGTAGYATISPDGKYVVYAKGEEGEVGLWIRQVATSTEIVVIPPSDVRIEGSTFSNDGNYVYFTASFPDAPLSTVYRTPVIGGATPRKILANVDGPVSLSPDDSRFAFFRTNPATGEEAIYIANADGSGERKLSSRDGKNLFYTSRGAGPAWSPDGRVIAAPAGSTVGGFSLEILVVGVDDGRENIFTKEGWFNVGRIAWLPDGMGLIACAEVKGEPVQISFIAYPGGEASRITNDLLTYGPSSLSVTRDASAIVSAQTQSGSTLMMAPGGKAAAVREITRGATRSDGQMGLAWLNDSEILYTSSAGGTTDLWIARSDGSTVRQLTFSRTFAYEPAVDGPGKAVYYVSNDDPLPHVWRVNSDGGEPVRITDSEDYSPAASPDGTWLLYDSWRSGARSIWKLKIGSADDPVMFRAGATDPKFSPDGGFVACQVYDESAKRNRMAILSFPAGETIAVFDFPSVKTSPSYEWAPDGQSLHFVDSRKGVSNIRSYDYRSQEVKDVTNFTSGQIFRFAWSPDGKNLAVSRGQSTSDVVLLSISK